MLHTYPNGGRQRLAERIAMVTRVTGSCIKSVDPRSVMEWRDPIEVSNEGPWLPVQLERRGTCERFEKSINQAWLPPFHTLNGQARPLCPLKKSQGALYATLGEEAIKARDERSWTL